MVFFLLNVLFIIGKVCSLGVFGQGPRVGGRSHDGDIWQGVHLWEAQSSVLDSAEPGCTLSPDGSRLPRITQASRTVEDHKNHQCAHCLLKHPN
jgi:hypothetical protein